MYKQHSSDYALPMRRWVNTWLREWGEWYEAHILRSVLGYPSDVSFKRLVDTHRHGAIVPAVDMPYSVVVLTDILIAQDKRWQNMAVVHYVYGKQITDYRALHTLHCMIEACYLYGAQKNLYVAKNPV